MDFRLEHPRPELVRENWLSLNGVWDFEIDNERVGIWKGYEKRDSLTGKINVPFCPESALSGVAHTDFIYGVWYRRDIEIPKEWAGKRIILHFEACDYLTRVFVNGNEVGKHKGGYTPFSFDITDLLLEGGNYITVYAEDDPTGSKQVAGKQSHRLNSYGCYYTRTTGIWQSVWMEAAEPAHLVRYATSANLAQSAVTFIADFTEESLGADLAVTAFYDGEEVGFVETVVNSRRMTVTVPLSELRLWELGNGRLYDVTFEVIDGEERRDTVKGYFGMREVMLKKDGFYINGERKFGRFVLDQGFYPDGIYTAPSDAALEFDIKASMSFGFNGARLHQKVFEPRYLYHADKLGYMVFDEAGNWGLDCTEPSNVYNFLPEWIEEMERDACHPSVIGWCPFNETWDVDGRRQSNELMELVYNTTYAIDASRLIVTNSGSYPCPKNDAYDVHDYEQDPEKFKEYYAHIKEGIINCQLMRRKDGRQKYDGKKPVFVSEYGGIKWVIGEDSAAWGYGQSVTTEEEFFARLKGLTDVLLDNEDIFAYCYTQITDVEQEQNGLMTYDRRFKFPAEKLAEIFGRKSVIEE